MKKVGLDVDGVLADFYTSMCDKYNKPYDRVVNWDVDFIGEKFHEIIEDKVFWGGLKVLNHPNLLTFDFDFYITAIPEGMLETRVLWLLEKGFPNKPVIVAEDKVTACRENGVGVLIDDKPSTLKMFKHEEDLIGIQYIPPYSDMPLEGDYHVNCLTEIKDILLGIE